MEIKNYRLFREDTDIVEHVVFSRAVLSYSKEELETMLEAYRETALTRHQTAYPLVAALFSALESIPQTRATFGDLLEIRHNNALKNFSLE